MSKIVIHANKLNKIYKIYDKPIDRLKETFGKKNYSKDFYALNNVSFDIVEGETVGIIGRNGSGKSTLLKILTGVLNNTDGEIDINGKISALLELGAGFNQEFTGIENIYLNGTIMNVSREEMESKLDDIIKFADIGEHIYQPVKTYSSGMFVRLAFAVAINVNPDILIVDEALAVGDTRFQLKCMDKFMEFMKAGKTVLFVSHDVNSIKRFCKRTIWLNNGKLIMDGNTDEVTDQYMDFLKSELTIEEYLEKFKKRNGAKVEEETIVEGNINQLGEIQEIQMFNSKNEVIHEINNGEDVILKIKYNVFDLNVEKPVVGVAIRSIDNKYICGLNTLLDGIDVPWKIGENEIILRYERFNLTGGNYYFDVAIFDKTATVSIDYKSKIKTFFVKMEYIAEGIVVLNHSWKVN